MGWLRRRLPAGITSLVAVFLVSRGLGFLREIGLAFYFGTSIEADRFAAAFIVAGVATLLIGETYYASSARVLGRLEGARRDAVAEAIMHSAAKAGVLITLIFAVVGPVITILILRPAESDLGRVAVIAIALAPSVGATAPIAVCNARLTLERRISIQIAAQALWSLGALVGLGVIAVQGEGLGTIPVALGWSLGNIVSALVLRVITRRGNREAAGERSPHVNAILRMGLPVAIAYSFTVVQELTDRAVAQRLGTGNLAALSYANRFVLLPIGIVIGVLGPLVLATFSLGGRDPEALRRSVPELRRMVNTLIALGLIFAALGPPAAELAFQRGAFDQQSSDLVQSALLGFAVGVPGIGFSLLLFRVMQAVAPLRDLLVIALVSAALNVALSIPLAIHAGILGVALGTSLVGYVTSALQISTLRTLGSYWISQVTRMFLRGICSAGAAISILLLALY